MIYKSYLDVINLWYLPTPLPIPIPVSIKWAVNVKNQCQEKSLLTFSKRAQHTSSKTLIVTPQYPNTLSIIQLALFKWPKIAKMPQKWPKMAQKLAPSAIFCISEGPEGQCRCRFSFINHYNLLWRPTDQTDNLPWINIEKFSRVVPVVPDSSRQSRSRSDHTELVVVVDQEFATSGEEGPVLTVEPSPNLVIPRFPIPHKVPSLEGVLLYVKSEVSPRWLHGILDDERVRFGAIASGGDGGWAEEDQGGREKELHLASEPQRRICWILFSCASVLSDHTLWPRFYNHQSR